MANPLMSTNLDLRGLDLVTPVDLLANGHTPYAKNFRLYAQQTDDRQVAVSSRKGSGFYTQTLGEALDSSNTATTNAGTSPVALLKNIHLQPFQATTNNRLTRIDLNISSTGGSGPVMVRLYSSVNNLPGALLAESSISSGVISSTPQYLTARFIKAPKLAQALTYWIEVQIQDDGKEGYRLGTTTAGTVTYMTSGSLSGALPTTYALNYRVYTAPDLIGKGAYRFTRDNGLNTTIVCYGTNMYAVNDANGQLTTIATGLSSLATEYSFANGDNKVFWVNGFDQLMAWNGTTVETITNANLPILSDLIMHKDRLWGVAATDPNKLVFSENPGNPAFSPDGSTALPSTQQWYYAWLSVSFIYVPRPHNGSPITKLVSFQDSLTVFTQDKKYVITGYDRGSLNLRESTGVKGAISRRSVTSDENNIYFVSSDGFYSYNGSKDDKISYNVKPLFNGFAQKDKITPVLWKNQVRFYLASNGSAVNDTCLVYEKDLKEMEFDTETYVDRALFYNDANDEQQLVEFSSYTQTAFLAETGYNNLGAPIDFEYRLKYDSMKSPAQKKRITKYFPLLQGVDSTFPLVMSMDKDFQDSPRTRDVLLVTNGAKLGQFKLGDGTILHGDTSFKMHRQPVSGYAYYWQLRISRKGVDNRVAFIGAQFAYKTKRL